MIEGTEVLLFFRQLSIAVAGATAFWGSLFLFFSHKSKSKRGSALWQGIAQKLLLLFYPALFSYLVVWLILAVRHCVFCARAHEGIALMEKIDELPLVLAQQYPLIAALAFFWILGLALLFFMRRFFLNRLYVLYGISFVTISILLLFPWSSPVQETARHYVSSALHGWHSILTLGSVIVVDFLFLTLKFNLRPFLEKIFPLITFGIWLGLGLDFLNSGLIFNEAFSPTARVLFMQTLIGILIINGVLLSGPIARAVIAFQDRMKSEYLPSSLKIMLGVSGTISITSWASITALDGFRSLTFSWEELTFIYVIFIGIVFILREIIERVIARYTKI